MKFIIKFHLQTLCGLCHYDFNDPNSYSYEQAFQAMRQLRLPYADAEQLYKRMVCKWLARHQMSVNGKRENISADDLLMVGKQMNIKKDKEIIKKVQSVISQRMTYARQTDIPEKQAISIGSTHLADL